MVLVPAPTTAPGIRDLFRAKQPFSLPTEVATEVLPVLELQEFLTVLRTEIARTENAETGNNGAGAPITVTAGEIWRVTAQNGETDVLDADQAVTIATSIAEPPGTAGFVQTSDSVAVAATQFGTITASNLSFFLPENWVLGTRLMSTTVGAAGSITVNTRAVIQRIRLT